MRVARTALLCLLVLTGVTACGEEETATPPPPATTATEPPPATTEPAEEPARLRLEEIASGLDSPLYVAAAPGAAERLYVVEQTGRIRVLEDGTLREAPFLDVSDRVTAGGEQGLLSVAFHPDYEENGRLYVNYTDTEGDTRVVEYRANGDRTAADPGSARELLFVEQPFSNHNGGQLQFGPDGLLYVGMGDGGAGGDPDNRAQNLGDRLGKLLRLDVDADGADWEIAAYGLRNPWRFSFDRENGDLYLADVGQNSREEVDYVPWPLDGLVNFGWDIFEGDVPYEEKEPNPAGRLVGPVATYGREGGCSVTGGYPYRGQAIAGLSGRYFYGDYCSGLVWSFRIENGRAIGRRQEAFTVEELSSFGEDAAGELYLVSLGGTVYRLAV
jgi:glucose/arabinose dehydrogenase